MPARGSSVEAGERRQRWPALLARLLVLGAERYPPKIRRRLQTLNAMAYLIVITSTIYALIYAAKDVETYHWIVLVNLVLAAVGLCVPLAHRLHELAGGGLILVCEPLALFALAAVLGRDAGIQFNLIVGAAAPFVILGLRRRALVGAVVVLCCGLHVAAWFLFPPGQALIAVEPDLVRQLYVSSAITTFGVTAALFYYAFHLAEAAEAETEALLRNILPDSVVERLRARSGEAVAESFAEASVLFADLKGFVPLSRRLGAERTVAMLNDLVRGFDGLAAQHGVEKIKTIGDCYMAVAGLPERTPDHAARLARFALAMQAAAEETGQRFGLDLHLRIGLASGPVMAGVIGAQKFTYDVWGDAVNLASRLEATGEPGRIHVSAAIREKLAAAFAFACRGDVLLKGVGPQRTWYLLGESRRGVSDSRARPHERSPHRRPVARDGPDAPSADVPRSPRGLARGRGAGAGDLGAGPKKHPRPRARPASNGGRCAGGRRARHGAALRRAGGGARRRRPARRSAAQAPDESARPTPDAGAGARVRGGAGRRRRVRTL